MLDHLPWSISITAKPSSVLNQRKLFQETWHQNDPYFPVQTEYLTSDYFAWCSFPARFSPAQMAASYFHNFNLLLHNPAGSGIGDSQLPSRAHVYFQSWRAKVFLGHRKAILVSVPDLSDSFCILYSDTPGNHFTMVLGKRLNNIFWRLLSIL